MSGLVNCWRRIFSLLIFSSSTSLFMPYCLRRSVASLSVSPSSDVPSFCSISFTGSWYQFILHLSLSFQDNISRLVLISHRVHIQEVYPSGCLTLLFYRLVYYQDT